MDSTLSASANAAAASSPRSATTNTARFRASVDANSTRGWSGSTGSNGSSWRSTTTGGVNATRPASELLSAAVQSNGASGNAAGSSQGSHTAEAEAIDRWFEDLRHYEQTLEEMAAASLDANFKEELTAIEQWFKVLSEAERTAALYSLLQSSTPLQMRFFITVLQQMARTDEMGGALMSPANPTQLSLEAQMDAKLASMGLKTPASPAMRQFARQSLGAGAGAGDSYLSPHSAHTATLLPPSPVVGSTDDGPAASRLASERAKLKASSRTSAPANLLLNASNSTLMTDKSPLWSENQTVMERRSPSPESRPKSTGSEAGPTSAAAPTSAYLRSPAFQDLDNQLSPLVGGSWASMVNTPLVPLFAGKAGEEPGSTMEPGNFGLRSPNLDSASARLNSWQSQAPTSPNAGRNGQDFVLDDVRKFRRSARVGGGGGGGVGGGALGGMYDHNDSSAARRSQAASSQQNAINLGLGGLSLSANSGSSQRNANGSLNSPGLQQAAMAAQQNWRNGLNSPGLGSMSQEQDQFAQQLNNMNGAGGLGGANAAIAANAQLANLFALQQQLFQQQQQLNNFAAAGLNLSPAQSMGFHQQQQQQQAQNLLNPGRHGIGIGNIGGMGMGGFGGGMNLGMGIGLNGMPSPRRSPRAPDRSPGGFNNKGPSTAVAPGSGANPDEPLDMALLGDVSQWLRSLRLHKYTPNFETSNWKEMIMLDDTGLQDKGVSALGARRKLLKVFETVRLKTGQALPGDGASPNLSVNVTNDGASNASLSPVSPSFPDHVHEQHDA